MSKKKFKVGDVVELVNGRRYSIYVENKPYTVVKDYAPTEELEQEGKIPYRIVADYPEDFELVQEEQKAMQAHQNVQITDEMILVVLEKLDAYARGYDPCEFGLPLYSEYKGEMVLIVKEALGILTERDKQIKQLQDIAGIDREQAEKLIEAGIIANVIGGNV